ncbi:hypothetical protein E3T24_05910 [Cryobacterium sp. TmT2-59]|uniref:hypothetical protein n=1 Tax=unclassified Cryobacterium TaxID=2649013 RepID=UPI00106D07DE|nr:MULTISPECIES: hypothetical protein [unclassified Cryobacterium]TFC86913.1 hypothetical protein E3T24_05910 [Cryobacterium sp. TmT2-59]TFD14628.1 hypothetical protein E3T42_11485 [Cryobacterium sp. TMT4-10]TFD18554.1 hypothetical protein E3T32_12100 [Cryobacterium sp. TMT2-23]
MIRRQAPSDGVPGSSGITRLTTEHGSVLLIDGDLRAYRRTPGPAARQLPGDHEWLSFSGIGPVEIGSPLGVVSASQVTGRYVSAPIVSIELVKPARELSAAEIETVHFVGDYINYRVIPQFEP